METAIAWMYQQMAKRITYSMVYRNGPNSYDCSSAVYFSLRSEGKLPADHRTGNTDSLFGDLERTGWTQTNRPTRGSIFIWGTRGASGGAAGHTGIFVNESDIIHCASGYNGIHVDNHAWLRSINGNPTVTFYTYTGAAAPAPYVGDRDQNVDIGSTVRFDGIFTVRNVELHGAIWQVQSDELCREDFSWDDNGIPAEPLWEVDSEGYRTPDQDLDAGSKFKLPGKYTILDIGEYKGRWLGLIQWGQYKFWVDLEPATEILAGDPGTDVPPVRPAPPQTNEPGTPVVVPPVVAPPKPDVETQPEVPAPDDDIPQVSNPPKENEMAFTEAEQAQLAIATDKIQSQFNDIAQDAYVKELTDTIPKKVKVAVYIVGDTLIALGGLTPLAAVAFEWAMTVSQITALAGLFAGAGLALLTAFGIYKSGKK